MPHKEFLETYPLYKRFEIESMSESFEQLEKVAINMNCSVCKTDQTFLVQNQDISYKIPSQIEQLLGYHQTSQLDQIAGFQQNISIEKFKENAAILSNEFCFHSIYICTHCQQFERYFYIKVDKKSKSIRKVGQYPPWEIKSNRDTKYFSDKHSSYFKKALVCESQGYGIAAFSYYRRIVEEIIDSLLNEISELLYGEELEKYKTALEEIQKTIVTQNKIDLVKDLLPPTLRPEGHNPLALMHSTLSEGLHAESDDECLQCAMECREIIVFLVNQINDSKATTKKFTDNMKNLLDKKARKEINKNKK
jgi:tetratricopeptide (TPR) repeat protein